MRIQRRIKGQVRRQFATSVIAAIEKAIKSECKRYGVSRSFVIANALAFTFGIKTEDYVTDGGNKNVVKFRKRKTA